MAPTHGPFNLRVVDFNGEGIAYVVKNVRPDAATLSDVVKAFTEHEYPGVKFGQPAYLIAAQDWASDEMAKNDGRLLGHDGGFLTIPAIPEIGIHHDMALDATRSLDEDPVLMLSGTDFGKIVAPNLSKWEAELIYGLVVDSPAGEGDDICRKMLTVMEARA